MNQVLSWFITWTIVIVGLSLLTKTKWGYGIVYGLLWLTVLLLVLMNADELTNMFNVSALQLNG